MKRKRRIVASLASAILFVSVIAPAKETKAFWGGFGGGWYDAGWGFLGYGDSGNDNACPPTQQPPQSPQPSPQQPDICEDENTQNQPTNRVNTPNNENNNSSNANRPPSHSSQAPNNSVTVSAPATPPASQPAGITQTDQAFAEEALAIVNQHRKDRGIPPLTLKSDLIRFAAFKAEDMRDHNYFSHTSPNHGSPWELSDKLGIPGVAGEVIAMTGDPSPSKVIAMWMNSKGHRDILMSTDYQYFGVARRDNYFAGVTGW